LGQQNPQPEAADFDPADALRRSGTSSRSFKSASPGYGMSVPVVYAQDGPPRCLSGCAEGKMDSGMDR